MEVFLQAMVLSLSNAAVYVVLGTSVSLIFGILGVLNFAQGDFMTIGAYVGLSVVLGLSLGAVQSLFLVLPVMLGIGICFYYGLIRPMRRHSHEMLLVATFGLAILLQGAVQMIWGGSAIGIERNTASWRFGGVAVSHVAAVNMVLAVTCLGGLTLLLSYTNLGREIRATAQDRVGAEITGIVTGRVEVAGMCIALLLTGVAGLMILQRSLLTPQVGFEIVLKAFAITILAGLGSVKGLAYAGLILGISEGLFSTFISSSLVNVVSFAAMAIALLLRPTGISGIGERT